jgi:hypothetical protein
MGRMVKVVKNIMTTKISIRREYYILKDFFNSVHILLD